MRTGESVEATPDDVGWCISDNEYEYDDSPYGTRYGEAFTTPCNLSGDRQPAPAEPENDLGISIDGMFVWVDESGLHGARIAN